MRAETFVVHAWSDQMSAVIIGKAVRYLKSLKEGHMQSGGDTGLGNVWDEVCVQVQGERFLSWHAYEDVMTRYLFGEVDALQRPALLALWLRTSPGWDWIYDERENEVGDESAPVDQDEIIEWLYGALIEKAGEYENKRIVRFKEKSDDSVW